MKLNRLTEREVLRLLREGRKLRRKVRERLRPLVGINPEAAQPGREAKA